MVTNSEFFDAVYGTLDGEFFGWQVAFRGDPNKVPGDAWNGSPWMGTARQRELIDRRLDDNVYYATSLLQPIEGDRPRRIKGAFHQARVLLADDANPDELNGKPSFIIQTSPGKRQIGVLLDPEDPATRDLELVEAVVQAMADAGVASADQSGNNVVRLGRPPNGTNGKGEQNYRTHLVLWEPGNRYSLEDAAAVFGIDLDMVRARKLAAAPTKLKPVASDAENAELFRRIQSGESYHDPLIKLSAKLVASGASGGAVVNLLRGVMEANGDRSERWKSRYDEIPRMVQGAERFRPETLPPITINLNGKPVGPAPGAIELTPMDWAHFAQMTPEPPVWRLEGWLPARTTTLLSANGGVGKSNISLQLAASLALGRPFLGIDLEPARVLVLSAEDEARTVHFRLSNICADLGVGIQQLEGRLTAYDLTQADCVLYRDGAVTDRMQWLADRVAELSPEVVIIDNASDVYADNENDRAAVRGFMRALNSIALHSGAAILLLAHVDKASVRMGAGQDTNSTFSGSTAWNNSARSRWAMTRNNDTDRAVVLRHEKCNYGALQADIHLEFDAQAKVFRKYGQVPSTAAARTLLENSEREAVFKLVAYSIKAGQKLSLAATANNNAHKVVAGAKSYPKRVERRQFFSMLYDFIREGLLEEVEYQTTNRSSAKPKCLALTQFGIERSLPAWET